MRIDLRSKADMRNDIPIRVMGIIMSCLLFLALEALEFRVFGLADVGVSAFLFAAVGVVTVGVLCAANMYLGERHRFGRIYVAAGFVAIFILAALILKSDFQYGLNWFADQLSQLRTEATGRMQRRFDTGADPERAARVASLFQAVLTGGISYMIAFEEKKVTIIMIPLLLLLGAMLGMVEPDRYFVAVIGVLLLVVAVRFLISNNGLLKGKGAVVNGVAMAVTLAAISAAVFIFPWQGEHIGGTVRDAVEDQIHGIRYEKHENPLPEGDLTGVGEFRPTGRTSLTVEMSRPEPLYLRGFVGEDYADGRWTRQADGFYSTNSNLFYWLHEGGFYAQSQRAALNKLINDEDVETLKIANVSACSKYTYAPYTLYQGRKPIADRRGIGDLNIPGERSRDAVTMSYIPGTTYQSYRLQKEYATGVDATDELVAYRNAEDAYRQLVHDSYLDIPEETEKVLESCLGKKEKLSTTQAKVKILKYLDDNITYREHVASNDGEDIIQWFLTGKKSGHSVHYAAASAMMLRYYGIPARYVEGFMVSREDAKEIGENATYPITEKMSHAWAEYYLDGVGWIPFESVPGKRDSNMYAAAGNTQAQEGGEGAAGKKEDAQKGKSRDDEEEKVSDKTNFNNPINSWSWIFAFRKLWAYIIGGLVLLLVLAYVISRRLRLRRFTRTFAGEDLRKGIINAFAYSEILVKRKVIDRADGSAVVDGSTLVDSVRNINDMALYSTLEMDPKQRSEVLRIKDAVLREYKLGRNPFQKAYDMLIVGIY